MRVETAHGYLKDLVDHHPLQSITLHGGEPFLYFENVKEILKKAKELGIAGRGIITNGYWARTPDLAEKKLLELKEAGLTHMTISVDVFHQEFIPLENVKNAIISASQAGFERIWVDSYFLGGLDTKNSLNDTTTEILAEFKGLQLDNVEFHLYEVGFEGRGGTAPNISICLQLS